MYELKMTITDEDEQSGQPAKPEFLKAATEFLDAANRVSGLRVEAKEKTVPGTRGAYQLLHDIIVGGASAGVFSAIYVLAKDLFSRYHSSELELAFPDGSKLKLKNLSEKDAIKQMKEHLERTRKSKK